MKKRLYAIVRVVISLFLIALLLFIMRGNYAKIVYLFTHIHIKIFIMSFVYFVIGISIATLRLKLIIQAQELKVTFFEAINLTFIGYFFNNFLPTAIGGDFVKAYYVSKKTKNVTASYASVFMDRFLGLLTMMLMAACALFILKGFIYDKTEVLLISIAVAGALFFLSLLFNKGFASRFAFVLKIAKPLEDKLKKLYNAIHSYRKNRMLLLQSFILSFFSQFVYFYSVFLLALSIGFRLPMKELFLRIPLVSALALLPSINGLGVREGSIVMLFGPLIGKENAFAVSLLTLATLMIISFIGGLIYAFSPQFKVELKSGETLETELTLQGSQTGDRK